jgi:hypothetical protein
MCYEVIPELFPLLFKSGMFFKVEEGIPEDAAFQGFSVDSRKNCIVMYMSHPSFDIVPEGQEIPISKPMVLKRYSDKAISVLEKFIENMNLEDGNGKS